MNISIKLIDNGSEYIANCPELDINCYAPNKEDALRRIKAVIYFYINSAEELGISTHSVKDKLFEESDSDFYEKMMTVNGKLIN
jgi:hypothetical protein